MTRNFKNLKVYQYAFQLSKDLFQFFEDKKPTSYRSKEQLLASVLSVCANIAEMTAFDSKPAQKQKVTTCIGECNELEFWMDLMQELKVLPQPEHIDFMERLVT